VAKFDMGHLRSQKFAALVFCVFVIFVAAFVLVAEVFSTLVMGIVALYTAFVGGRAWSDGQALKFGGTVNTVDATVTQQSALKNKQMPPKEKEVD
jgi:hypothetical protein